MSKLFWLKFQIKDDEGTIGDALATDSEYMLDGRNSLFHMKLEAFSQLRKLKKVRPHYLGFKIMKGDDVIITDIKFNSREELEKSAYYCKEK